MRRVRCLQPLRRHVFMSLLSSPPVRKSKRIMRKCRCSLRDSVPSPSVPFRSPQDPRPAPCVPVRSLHDPQLNLPGHTAGIGHLELPEDKVQHGKCHPQTRASLHLERTPPPELHQCTSSTGCADEPPWTPQSAYTWACGSECHKVSYRAPTSGLLLQDCLGPRTGPYTRARR